MYKVNACPGTALQAALSSWVPDFARRPVVTPFISLTYQDYKVDRGSMPNWSLSADLRRLITTGIVCDEIVDLSPGTVATS